MTQDSIYSVGQHEFTRIDRHGHEETWTWVVTPLTVKALNHYNLIKQRNAQ